MLAYVKPDTVSVVVEKYGNRVSISLSWEEWDAFVTRVQEARKQTT